MKQIIGFMLAFVTSASAQKPVTFISGINDTEFVHLYNSLAFEEGGQLAISFTRSNEVQQIFIKQPVLLYSATYLQEPVYVEPGDSIIISRKNMTVFAQCINNSLRNNEILFLSSISRDIGNIKFPSFNFLKGNFDKKRIRNHDMVYQDSLYKELYLTQKSYLEEFNKSHQLTEGFKKFVQSFFLFSAANNLIDILLKRKSRLATPFLNEIITNARYTDSFFVEESQYKAYLRVSKMYSAFCNARTYLDEIKIIKDTAIKNYLLYRIVCDKLEDDSTNIYISRDSLISFFEANCTNNYYKLQLNKNCYGDSIFSAKDELLTIEHLPYENSNSLFSDSTERLIYIDFWASWCKPCLEELKFSTTVHQAFPKLKTLFISMDTDPLMWIRKQKSFPFMNAKNSFLLSRNFASFLAKRFSINAIPRYILLDCKGKILNADALRPSDPKFCEFLKKYKN